MIIEGASEPRELKTESLTVDLVVVGGGLSGVCAAIAAARNGMKVVLLQDRPVLGGNASSEVRLWILGATSHGGNNNRWAREGGIINELLLENQFRNPGGNPVIFDSILQDWVTRESNLKVILNSSVFHADTVDNHIQSVHAFNSQNSTMYQVSGKFFVDSSGDGVLTHLSGAAYRMGAEEAEEFNEPMAPGDDYGKLLGHSLYFYSKDVGKPVDYVAPDFALKDIPSLIPRYKSFNATDQGCSLWWIEWGGRLDTIHESEDIKTELQKVVYGVWNYIKNSGEFPEAANLALEWVGTIPGKRESRRAEGDYILRQRDIVEQVEHDDNVAHGGWSIDLHPADGVYGAQGGCNQYHAKGVFGIPYRCMYSRNISNLFINGRLLSASHVAFGSTRVMATSAAIGQVIGTAASVCVENGLAPRDLLEPHRLNHLKQRLSSAGHYVPKFNALERENYATKADIKVSSELSLQSSPHNGEWKKLQDSYAQLIPLYANQKTVMTVPVKVSSPTELRVEIRKSEKAENHTPEVLVEWHSFLLTEDDSEVSIPFSQGEEAQYMFVCFMQNEFVQIGLSDLLLTGLMSVKQGGLAKVSTTARQEAPEGLGVDSFDFWVPERRPEGKNIAFEMTTPLFKYSKQNLISGATRPTSMPNAWAADIDDISPTITLDWPEGEGVLANNLTLFLDCDYDHPLESVQYLHNDRVMPHLVHQCEVVCDDSVITNVKDNRQGVISVSLPAGRVINRLSIKLTNSQGHPVSVLGIRVQ
ncbi:FAD-dependent oxidoreductase [Vibrio sp. ER1A]|uniref:FAD-dependent oxidoreductase n=1 Tax=Vibrio sp. ER1A TaxID=1517681 RepID=UPI0004DD0060|nr:FAD-dependent oxidoreductase [Vibrio sp. ER1A]KFA94998.1 fumarate reductase [Vibrio sp. ER1A]